ncbi:XRE family transcriptional regulator [Dactylosporangium sp. CS-033363]|uniref:XRE family transcriptional regulator n=1 Tax=Dactylosporangium sp. CS-033363 TaxID=3239935 RepID=UPI003D90D0F5
MNVRVYGERLRDARVVQALLSKDVAQRAGLAPSQLTRLEHATYTDVNEETAERLANALAFPLAFFSYSSSAHVKPGTTLFRARKSMSRREEEQLHSWSRLSAEIFASVVSKVEIPSLTLPSPADFSDPESAASATRRAFGLDLYAPIPHVMRAVERAGVPVVSLDFESDVARHDAFSCWVGTDDSILDEWPLMLLRTIDSWERTRFSIGHELGHIVMHRRGVVEDSLAEQQAHDFARFFLLPGEVLKSKWPDFPTLNGIMHLKAEYGLSLSGIIEHAWRIGLIDDARRISFYKQLSNRRDALTGLRWREQEPGSRDREAERPRLVSRMIEAVFGEGLRVAELSAPTGYWPLLYLRRILASQVWSGVSASNPHSSSVISLSRRRA